MNNHVPFQRLLVTETLRADFALVVPFLQVHRSVVAYQMVAEVEAAAASLALVNSCGLVVDVLEMYGPRVVRVEPLRAYRTPARVLLEMHAPNMQGPLVWCTEGFVASIAREVPGFVHF